jgi:hypothetical protein
VYICIPQIQVPEPDIGTTNVEYNLTSCTKLHEIPHCIVNEAMSILQNNKQDYFLFTLGVRSIINAVMNRGKGLVNA